MLFTLAGEVMKKQYLTSMDEAGRFWLESAPGH
jgi:hypothetical protein